MSVIQQQTFDVKDCEDELQTISAAVDLIQKGRTKEAVELLLRRHDELMKEPKLKPYDPREART